ncbi:ferritin-like domain-containing protein [Sulfurimonas sp. C5]|uniref:ferritin-like domain-containing protein n=1 Tax=Sulfurimonas sp. C5 TaxID=3036947 RepID=UPI002457C182|nr:ferritin-like domain-containing protein [Sulfurimonas sp. C5]MDH4943793.1 ferritin-like domain-containing protein [Sulfurimonas sp. C5]
MNKTYQKKHELWLGILFSSFAINDEEIKARLYDFSQIAFRHMKWLGSDILESNDDYNYDRDYQLQKHQNVSEILETLKIQIFTTQQYYPASILGQRLKTDDAYLLEYIDQLLTDENKKQTVTAFNMQREWENLDQSSIDALTLFLFEESYKEYELILVYAYMQARTKNHLHFNIFQDLIDESHFHLKSFGNMMSKLGILSVPRQLHEMTYMVTDLNKFVIDGIAEEEAAKEMCKQLSEAIKDEKLSKFFDFINFQESYHIELMKKLL